MHFSGPCISAGNRVTLWPLARDDYLLSTSYFGAVLAGKCLYTKLAVTIHNLQKLSKLHFFFHLIITSLSLA
jgi:hypothetical protein